MAGPGAKLHRETFSQPISSGQASRDSQAAKSAATAAVTQGQGAHEKLICQNALKCAFAVHCTGNEPQDAACTGWTIQRKGSQDGFKAHTQHYIDRYAAGLLARSAIAGSGKVRFPAGRSR